MRFEAREVPNYVEHVPVGELRHGDVYFVVSFCDHEMNIPEMRPVVFVGRDLAEDESGALYFQDYESYQMGARYDDSNDSHVAEFERHAEEQSTGVCEFERALDVLLRCSLRRGGTRSKATSP